MSVGVPLVAVITSILLLWAAWWQYCRGLKAIESSAQALPRPDLDMANTMTSEKYEESFVMTSEEYEEPFVILHNLTIVSTKVWIREWIRQIVMLSSTAFVICLSAVWLLLIQISELQRNEYPSWLSHVSVSGFILTWSVWAWGYWRLHRDRDRTDNSQTPKSARGR
jgi:hypothetical protein